MGLIPHLKLNEIGIPIRIARILTFPERVTRYNRKRMVRIVSEGRANSVKRGERLFKLEYAMTQRGTELIEGDIIVRDSDIRLYETKSGQVDMKEIKENPDGVILIKNPMQEKLIIGDRLIRDGVLIKNIKYEKKRNFPLRLGDIVERQLQDGDIILCNRQPTLHRGSMMAARIKIHSHDTIKLNLAQTSSLNADFDQNADL